MSTGHALDAMRAADWPQVRAIYLEGIDTGNATFEIEAPYWDAWDTAHLPGCRIVARRNGAVIGWAALSPVSRRLVYAGVTEVSVYVAGVAQGQSVGRALLARLISESERDGIWTLQSTILVENAISIALHKSMGFREVGWRERIGQRHGVWRDMILLERRSRIVGCDDGAEKSPTIGHRIMEGDHVEIAKPEDLGFSGKRLERINAVMQRYVDEKKLAGVITLVARRGTVVHLGECGMADIEASKPMQSDTIFRIYSMTKPITSTAVLMLMEEGRLRLADPVAQYIPGFKDVKVLDNAPGSGVRQVNADRPITIRDLMTHTAGLSYGFDDVYIDELYRKHIWGPMEANPDLTLADWMGELTKLPLAYQPGTRFRYSVATDVLGYLVQVISGMPFDAFLKQRIFEPLGMIDTDFWVPPDKVERFAANYGPDPEAGLKVIDPPATSHYTRPSKAPSGGGGLVSTTGDYLRFAQMLLNKGELDGVRLLGRKTVELMTANHLPDGVYCFDDPSSGFGLGVSVLLNLGKSQTLGSAGNFGWGGAANTNFWVDPQEELLGILMLQFMPSDTFPVVADFRNLTYQALVA